MGPKPYKVYIFLNGKMRKVAEYESGSACQRRLTRYAAMPRNGEVYLTEKGVWFRVKFAEIGSRDYPGWVLVESEGVR